MNIQLIKYTISLILMFEYSIANAEIGVKNFRQIIASFYAATDLSSSDVSLRESVRKIESRLPIDGTIEEISSPSIIALIELSGLFCGKLIDHDASISDASARTIHQTVNFNDRPRALNPAIRSRVVADYSEMFWQRSPTQSESDILLELFNNEISDNPNTIQATKRVLKAVCVGVAGTIESLIY